MNADPLSAAEVRIRPLHSGDGPQLLRFIQDPAVAETLFPSGRATFINRLLTRFPPLRTLIGQIPYAILAPDGRLIGEVRFSQVDRTSRSASLGIYIGDRSEQGRGYGTEALRLALQQVFTLHNLHRVELQVYGFNTRAIRSYEKLGFVREGTRRESLHRHGRFEDTILMSILQREFLAPGEP